MVMQPHDWGYPVPETKPDRALIVFSDDEKARLQRWFDDWDILVPDGRMQWPGKVWDVIVVTREPRLAREWTFVQRTKVRVKNPDNFMFLEP